MPAVPTVPGAHDAADTPAAPGRDPRVRAALCYAIPVVPACVMLLRVRGNGFIREHALRALLFYGAVALYQVALLLVLVALGGAVSNLALAVALGCVLYVLVPATAVAIVVTWLRLIAAALAGRPAAASGLGALAARLRRARVLALSVSASWQARENDSPHDAPE